MSVQDQLNRSMPAAKYAALGDILNDLITGFNALVRRARSVCLSNPGLAISAASSPTVKAVNAFSATAGGVLVTKPANTAMAALPGVLATAKSAAYAFYVDGTGTLSCSKTADSVDAPTAVSLIPSPPVDTAQLGFVTVTNTSGAGFTGGTTALDAAGIAVVYYNTTDTVVLAGSPEGTLLTGLESRRK